MSLSGIGRMCNNVFEVTQSGDVFFQKKRSFDCFQNYCFLQVKGYIFFIKVMIVNISFVDNKFYYNYSSLPFWQKQPSSSVQFS